MFLYCISNGGKASQMALTDCATSYFTINAFKPASLKYIPMYFKILQKCCILLAAGLTDVFLPYR